MMMAMEKRGKGDFDRIKWNEKYSKGGLESFRSAPSDWLVAHQKLIEDQPRGPALDLACGNGRNSFFLSKLGFKVDAVDISDVAIDWLKGKVEEKDVRSVFPKLMNLEEYPLPENKYQIVLNFNYLERTLFNQIKKSLVPGGLLFFETPNVDHIEILKSKLNKDFVLKHNELISSFIDMRILHYRELIVFEGSQGKKKALSSLVARKV